MNASPVAPAVVMAPRRWTIPLMARAPGLAKPAALVQPFSGVSGVNEVPDAANEAPSSEVSVWASNQVCSAFTVTTPLGVMSSRPAVAAPRSTGTQTLVAGRSPVGKVNGTGLAPVVAIAPLRWTIPLMLVTAGAPVPVEKSAQPFCSARLVQVIVSGCGADAAAWAVAAPATGSATAAAHIAPTAVRRSRGA